MSSASVVLRYTTVDPNTHQHYESCESVTTDTLCAHSRSSKFTSTPSSFGILAVWTSWNKAVSLMCLLLWSKTSFETRFKEN